MQYIVKDLGPINFAHIIAMSDLHIGSPYFSEKIFLDFRDWILKSENTYIVMPGDILNCATKYTKADIYSEIMTVQQAKKYAIQVLEPIMDRILGITRGNHELNIWKETGNDPLDDLATILKVPYHPDGLLLNIKLGQYHKTKDSRINYTLYMTHGYGGGRTKGSKVNVMDKSNQLVEADIYVVGHIHFLAGYKDRFNKPDIRHNRVDKFPRAYVSSGSFLDWGGYSEFMMLPPGDLGAPLIRLDGTQKRVNIII